MMLNISKIAAVAVAAGILVQASTVWHFPYKVVPFGMSHERPQSKSISPKLGGISQLDGAAIARDGMTVAHHKPPYHGGVPRSPQAQEGARDTA